MPNHVGDQYGLFFGEAMNLSHFYRQLFVDAMTKFEPVWEEDLDSLYGFRWTKNNYPNEEQFQITMSQGGDPVLMYSMILSEEYLKTTIYEQLKGFKSSFELSLVIVNKKLWLNVTVSTDYLEDSIMGFISMARSQLMNIIDCLITMPNPSYQTLLHQFSK
ncbi:MAG: hypothetical protein P0Y55_13885 [Candidatus Cohnella colombiensis]|uniref:Uncharacterized protein n=1 Tax=Candidatus Cohnella colombiensis TaxID=3121368 RepID=A0AA95EVJ1_9BACL|nr:MAG: hypothetical protein P0Y55_13885 [Cohnella sp.]